MPVSTGTVVSVEGLESAVALLAAITARVADMSPVLNGSISDLSEAFFLNTIANEGPGWKPLAPLTLQMRERAGHGLGGIGYDTGVMFMSLMNAEAPGAWKVVTPNSLERGTAVRCDVDGNNRGADGDVAYALRFHEGFAGNIAVPKQPARPLRPWHMPDSFYADTSRCVLNFALYATP